MPTFMRSLIWTDQGIRSIKADMHVIGLWGQAM